MGPPLQLQAKSPFAKGDLVRFIHELFKILHNLLKYNSKLNNPEKQSVFCTGWKACATKSFTVRRIIRVRGI